jgi:hypothetical protein
VKVETAGKNVDTGGFKSDRRRGRKSGEQLVEDCRGASAKVRLEIANDPVTHPKHRADRRQAKPGALRQKARATLVARA